MLDEAVAIATLRAAARVHARSQTHARSSSSDDLANTRLIVPQQTIAAGTRIHILDGSAAVAFTLDKATHAQAGLLLKSIHDGGTKRINAPPDISDTLEIQADDGSTAAIVHNALLSPLLQRWRIDVRAGRQLIAAGNILQHEYTIGERDGTQAAVVTKRFVRRRDAYGLDVLGGADASLILSIVLAIDVMCFAGGSGARRESRAEVRQRTRP